MPGKKNGEAGAAGQAIENGGGNAGGGKHLIVIATHGWIVVGRPIASGDPEQILLEDAYDVRRWTNGRNIGGLAKEEYKGEYTLDPFHGRVRVLKGAGIYTIECDW